ncbi:MAG TPA: hypothetical protein VMW18_06915 [Candidatus Binatia bacterium]|nr:hypothetical protein [Candidatus Binatia bacterium]
MDSVSDKVTFAFEHLKSDVDQPEEGWELLLRITADFSVLINGRMFYSEVAFPVVEFAARAALWLKDGGDLSYESMDSQEKPLLTFFRGGDGKFRPYSPHQEFQMADYIDENALRQAIVEFRARLCREAMTALDLNVTPVIGELG